MVSVGSFTVDVSELKPNKPNTMNLVKKLAQELSLSEDFVKGLVGSLGSGIIKGVEEKQKSILGLSPRMNSSSSQFSDASRPELSDVLDRKSTRLNSSHERRSRMPSSA